MRMPFTLIIASCLVFTLVASNSVPLAISPGDHRPLGPAGHCHFLAILPDRPKLRFTQASLTAKEWWDLLGAA
jgi:hypothetical protein